MAINYTSVLYDIYYLSSSMTIYTFIIQFIIEKIKLAVWIRCGPSLVFAAGRPNSNFLFLRRGFLFPPVALRLCQWSREIPTVQYW